MRGNCSAIGKILQINYCSREICFYIIFIIAEVCKKQTSVFIPLSRSERNFIPAAFCLRKNNKNYVKKVVKRKPVSLLIWRDIFSCKIFWKYRCQTVNFTIFVSLVYMEGKIFYVPRTFWFSCPWLSGKSFLREFSGIPSQMRCNFPI